MGSPFVDPPHNHVGKPAIFVIPEGGLPLYMRRLPELQSAQSRQVENDLPDMAAASPSIHGLPQPLRAEMCCESPVPLAACQQRPDLSARDFAISPLKSTDRARSVEPVIVRRFIITRPRLISDLAPPISAICTIRPSGFRHADVARQVVAAHHIQNDIDPGLAPSAAMISSSKDRSRVVNRPGRAQIFTKLRLLRTADRRVDRRCPQRPAELDGRRANPARTAMDQHAFTRREIARGQRYSTRP